MRRLFGPRWMAALTIPVAIGIGTGILISLLVPQVADYRETLVEGLKAPRGITPLGDGSILIAEVLGGRLLRLTPAGELTTVQEGLPATLGGPGGGYPTGISASVRIQDAYYYVVGEFRGSRYSALYQSPAGEKPDLVAGGTGPDGFPASRLTNPYDLVALPRDGFLVSDSGVNAVLRVSRAGDIADYASFPRRNLATPSGNHHFDVVPTGLTIGPDGALYLASFTGYPYPQNAAIVYRLEDLNRDGDAMDPGEVAVFAQGFSVATDLSFAADGSLLVTEFSTNMSKLIDEFGIESAAEVPGRLVRWHQGDMEVVAEGLVSPTAVAIVDGRIIVSEEFAGRVTEIRSGWVPESVAKVIPAAAGLVAFLAALFPLMRWRRLSRPPDSA